MLVAHSCSVWAIVWEGCQKYKPYLIALAIYASSRLVVLWAIYIASRFVLPAPRMGLSDLFASASWYRHLLRWDSIWYASIVNEGYSYNGNVLEPQSVVLYPLYPLIARALTIFPGFDGWLALLAVANVAAILSALLLFEYVSRIYGHEVAYRTIAFLSFFPSSLFLSAGYTKSLALLLILSFFIIVAVAEISPRSSLRRPRIRHTLGRTCVAASDCLGTLATIRRRPQTVFWLCTSYVQFSRRLAFGSIWLINGALSGVRLRSFTITLPRGQGAGLREII